MKVFLSYARDDDEPFVKRLYEDLTTPTRNFTVWWDRVSMPNRALTFLQEIRDAVENSDRQIAVIGPKAVQSDYVRAEWEHALLFCKGVIPLLRKGDHSLIPPELCKDDYSLIPAELSQFHSPDFRVERPYNEALEELLRILDVPVPALGSFLTLVPSLPPHFLPRRDDITRLGETVLTDIHRPTVITSAKQTTALQGMGGVGKSVLAAAFARAADTRRACTDGILWLTIGQRPDLLQTLRSIGLAFGDEEKHYTELKDALDRLPRVLADKVCLIALDDVWDVAPATPFRDALGPRCRLLITTRDGRVVTALGAQEHRLDVLSDEAALKLLADWSEQPVDSLPTEARAVVDECGNLPLALAMIGAMVRGKPNRWENALHKLRNADLEKIRQQFPNYPYPDLLRAIQVSVDALEPEVRIRYLDFAVFPEDTPIPEAVLQTFWKPEGLDKFDTQDIVDALVDRSLAQRDQGGRLTLHNLQFDYVCKQADDLPALHNRLLSAYAAHCPNSWPTGPHDGYFFQRLAYHLGKARRKEELQRLLFDFNWLQAKLEATDVNALIADYGFLTDDADLRLVQGALRLSAYALSRDKTQMGGQLLGRLMASEASAVQALLAQAKQRGSSPWLRPLTPSLDPPSGDILCTLIGHKDDVNAVSVTPDGRYAISASNDKTLKIWGLETGSELRTLTGHTRPITTVAVTSDGKRAVSASYDYTLKVWDLESGAELRTIHTFSHVTILVHTVVLTPDSKQAVCASTNKALYVWDLENDTEPRKLPGHTDTVTAVAMIPHSRRVVSASEDRTLRVWDLEGGGVLHTLCGHSDKVWSVAVTPDGQHAVSASADGTLKVWDIESGAEIYSLTGHRVGVRGVAVTRDGQYAISASEDSTLKVWDLHNRTELRTLTGHTFWVNAVTVTPDGRRAISASSDSTLKVWDLKSDTQICPQPSHADWVAAVVVTADGRYGVTSSRDHTLKVWDLQSAKEIHTLKGHANTVTTVAVTPDGRRAISAALDGTLRLWDLQSGKELRTMEGQHKEVIALAVMPNGKRAVSSSTILDDPIKFWDLESGKELGAHQGHPDWRKVVSVTSDGGLAVSASRLSDRTLKVWDLESGIELCTLAGHTEAVSAIAVTPDRKRAVSGSYDGTLKVWDLQSGRELYPLEENHPYWVWSVVVTPDGQCAISASNDRTLKVWDMTSGTIIASFGGERRMMACAVAPDGVTIVAGDESGRVHFLRLERAEQGTRTEGTAA